MTAKSVLVRPQGLRPTCPPCYATAEHIEKFIILCFILCE